jgi:hypothetical protein
MMRFKSTKILAGSLFVSLSACGAWAADQAKTIVNSIDPKSMNELFDALKTQPDAALTSISPLAPNKYRFLFIWPASSPFMTYERVGRSFAERFAGFAEQMKPLATGFCLTSRNMYFGTAPYGSEEVNIAYRDIEVHYRFGQQSSCTGRYIAATDLERPLPAPKPYGGYGAALPETPTPPQNQPSSPEEGLKPFLSEPPAEPPLQR